jgi:hypothetical protein
MISRRILFRRPNAVARTRLPPALSPSSHLVNRELGSALSSTRTVNYYASAAAAPAASATVPLHAASAIVQPSLSSTTLASSQQQPDFVQEAIQRLFKDAPVMPSPAASNASPSAPATASPSSSRSDPSPQVSEKVLELSIKTFQARTDC